MNNSREFTATIPNIICCEDREKNEDEEIKQFVQVLSPIVEDVLKQPELVIKGGEDLTVQRNGKCIYNDTIGHRLHKSGEETYLVWSNNTGRLLSGQLSSEVMHEHGFVVAKVKNTSLAIIIDVSAAQFSPINPSLRNMQVLVALTDWRNLKESCRNLFGGGDFQVQKWEEVFDSF